jgi:AcrR family transcriptional regulator
VGETRRAEIVAAAEGILDREGREALTMRALGAALGIRAPSLYKHLPDKQALEVALIAAGFEEIATVFERAVAGSADPVADLALAYRAWARAHPHRYRLLTDGPVPREALPEGVEARAGAPLLRVFGGDQAAARAAWGLVHGLASLELAGRFPPDADLDAAWAAGIAALRHLAEPAACTAG